MLNHRIAILLIIIGGLSACTTYRHQSFHFPLTVERGAADITFTVIPLNIAAPADEILKISAQDSKKKADNYRRLEKTELLPRISPSENDYQSTIRFRSPQYSPVDGGSTVRGRYSLYTPYKEYIPEKQALSLPIPRGCRIEMSVTNIHPEILEFTCGDWLFRLAEGESKALEFR